MSPEVAEPSPQEQARFARMIGVTPGRTVGDDPDFLAKWTKMGFEAEKRKRRALRRQWEQMAPEPNYDTRSPHWTKTLLGFACLAFFIAPFFHSREMFLFGIAVVVLFFTFRRG